MYINFEMLLRSGLKFEDLAMLCAIHQKDKAIMENMDDDTYMKLEELRYVEKNAAGRITVTKLGKAAIEAIETPGITDESEETLKGLIELYEENGKDIGISSKEAQSRLIWFMANTNFKKDVIINVTRDYIADAGQYVMSLCNLIWKPPSIAFSVHKNLKDSKLFDLVSKRYRFGTELFFKVNRSREDEWLMAVSRLPDPPSKPDVLFTMDKKKEKERLKELKTVLFNKIRQLR